MWVRPKEARALALAQKTLHSIAMHGISEGLDLPQIDIEILSDGNVLLIIAQSGEPTTKLILNPQTAIYLAQHLTAKILGRSVGSPGVLQAIQ